MPKKPRQAHISQQLKRRKARRPAPLAGAEPPVRNGNAFPADKASVFAEPSSLPEPAFPRSDPPLPASSPARAGRRMGALRVPEERSIAARAVPGQLPTFERAYLMRELRQIGTISMALLALIVVLTVILR
jgi:hypothetical protein